MIERPKQEVPKPVPVPVPRADLEDEGIQAALDRSKYPDAFEHLWALYRPIAEKNATKTDAHAAWKKLSDVDQVACVKGLALYVSWAQAEKRKRIDAPVKHLSTFINRRGWEPFLEGSDGGAVPPTTWVLRDAPRWTALDLRWRAEKGKPAPTTSGEGGQGWQFPSEWIEELKTRNAS